MRQGLEHRAGEHQIAARRDLDVSRVALDGRDGAAGFGDELCIIGDGRPIGRAIFKPFVCFHQDAAPKNLRRLAHVQAVARDGLPDEVIGADALERGGHGDDRRGRAGFLCRGEDGINPFGGDADARGIVDGDVLGVVVDGGQTVGDGVKALVASGDQLDAHEAEVRAVLGFHLVQIARRDDEDCLGDVLAIDEKLKRAEEERLIVESGKDFAFVAAESLAAARGENEDAHFDHGQGSRRRIILNRSRLSRGRLRRGFRRQALRPAGGDTINGMAKGEDELIAWIRSRSTSAPSGLVLGPGDDMAQVRAGAGGLLVACDLVMDGVDFDSAVHTPRQMGRKAMAVNLSDCAAMAVRPRWALMSVALPARWTMEQAQELFAGAESIAGEFDCRIIGGDTNSWDKPLVVDVTILAEPWDGLNGPVTRSGMRPGDALHVTGRLGGSIWEHHLTFTPRVREARVLSAALGPDLHAMMDLSDGLSVDAARMAAASGCGVELDEGAVRALHREVLREKRDDRSLTSHVLDDGEDFELFFAVPEHASDRVMACRKEGITCDLRRIGSAIAESGVWLKRMDGGRERVEPRGWRHFREAGGSA